MTEEINAGVDALLNPRNIAIVGASERKGSWAQIVRANLERFGFAGPVYPINPRYDTLWDRPCFPDVASLPEPPDHLVILVPAHAVPETLIAAGRAGARSATICSSGFAEGGDAEGQEMRDRLSAAVAESGIAVSGPNCMGNVAARSRLVTLADHRLVTVEPGPVAIVGQSGGIVMALQRRLNDRAIGWGYMVTSGNEIGVTMADYIDYMSADPEVRVVLSFIESVKDPARFLAACRAAHARGKHVVAIKIGGSEAGRAAALAHTGSLAGSLEAFDAAVSDAGVVRVDNLNDMIEAAEYLSRAPKPKGPGIGAITFSGGLKGLLVEAATRQGFAFPTLGANSLAALENVLGVGTSSGNPLDSGFTGLSDQDAYLECMEIMLRDPSIDVVMLQEELPRAPGSAQKEDNMRKVQTRVAAGAPKPIVFFSMISHDLTEYSRGMRPELPDVPFLQEVDNTLKALQYVVDRPVADVTTDSAAPGPAAAKLLARRPGTSPTALTEPESKDLIRAYGIATPAEALARSADEAADAAASIGYPVVLKAVSATVTHKSDAGGVIVGIDGEAALRDGFARITRNIAAHDRAARLDGILVAEQVVGGLELVIGIQHDPEMGPVVMFGSGGVWLELFKDVTFAAPPIDAAKAKAMIERTRAGRLLAGYRGGPAYDVEAVSKALIAVGRIAGEAGAAIDSLDINPFVALEAGRGAVALDALIVLRPTT